MRRAEKTKTWAAGSLEDQVSNLVKNWEKEASYKLRSSEWRTIDPVKYRFSCNGGPEVLCLEHRRAGVRRPCAPRL